MFVLALPQNSVFRNDDVTWTLMPHFEPKVDAPSHEHLETLN